MILDLLISDGFEPKKSATTNGGEYSTPCPACGGRDRFRSWPEKDRYWCRQCGKSGDSIQYLRDFHGLSFRQAAEQVEKSSFSSGQRKSIHARQKGKPEAAPDLWISKAERLVDYAHHSLLDSPVIMDWLKTHRGLSAETVKRNRIGWLDRNHFCERRSWGLPTVIGKNGQPKKLFVPSGLIIPSFEQNKIIRIRIRRNDPGDFGRYYVLPGSNMAPMILGELKPWPNADPAIIVESELDAMLMFQEIKSRYVIIALGSATVKPDDELASQLKAALYVIVSLDADEAGNKATQWWLQNFKNAAWFPMPAEFGKDPTEARLSGLDLGVWLQAAAIEIGMMNREPVTRWSETGEQP